MLRIGNYNPNNCNIRNNKNMQSQPAFKAITVQDAFEIGLEHNLPLHRAQQLIDIVPWINDKGYEHFKRSHMYRGQIKDPIVKPALEALIQKAQSGK